MGRKTPAVCEVSDHRGRGRDDKGVHRFAGPEAENIRQGELRRPGSSKLATSMCRPRTDRASAGRDWVGMAVHQTLKLFNGYRVVRPAPKAAPAGWNPHKQPWGRSRAGERSARNPHAAFDEAGAGNVAWPRWCDTRNRKSRTTEHKLRSKPARPVPDPTDERGVETELRVSH